MWVFSPDIPGETIAAHDDNDVGDAHIIKQHLYKMNPTKLAAVWQEVEYTLQIDIIEQTQNHWNSLYVLVRKCNDSYWFCIDFKWVNAVTNLICTYPFPQVDDYIN